MDPRSSPRDRATANPARAEEAGRRRDEVKLAREEFVGWVRCGVAGVCLGVIRLAGEAGSTAGAVGGCCCLRLVPAPW
nr:unnamed protein product [Digitaria exilis]